MADLNWTVSYRDVEVTCGQFCNPCFENKSNQGMTTTGTVDMTSVVNVNTNTIKYSSEINYISLFNSNGSSQDITMQIDESGTPKTIFKYTLLTNENLVYESGNGWQVI